ncbi:MAG: thrombospondin type 3 repeat-containing protein [Myxococcota bacterium]|nr:thrombospondin type 3 repeat-containing protein [Myxococcota bacterium]
MKCWQVLLIGGIAMALFAGCDDPETSGENVVSDLDLPPQQDMEVIDREPPPPEPDQRPPIPPGRPACSDGIDNDGDRLTDLDDPGCENADDTSEEEPRACSDGIDNDEDGLTDFPQDPGCGSARDNDEFNDLPLPGCSDGIDNDRNGLFDEEDPGCTDSSDRFEAMGADLVTECNDRVDNNGDGFIDFPFDIGCLAAGDPSESAPPGLPGCANGLDDDNDGLADFPQDPGCAGAGDEDEVDKETRPYCADGVDNDRDGRVDYPEDDGCYAASDSSERGSCGDTYDPPRLRDGATLLVDTRRGLFESKASCGGDGSPELVFMYRLTRRVEALEFSTVGDGTDTPTTLSLRRKECLLEDAEIACQREERNIDEAYGHTLRVGPLSPGEYYLYVDGVDGQGGQVAVSAREVALAECLNEIDDDEDGRIDYPYDSGCESPSDESETSPASFAACSNDEDDDGDGFVDFPLDPGCVSAAWDSEEDLCGAETPFREYFFGTPEVLLNTRSDERSSNAQRGTCGGADRPEVVFLYRNPQNARLVLSTDYPETESPTLIYIRRDRCDGIELRCADGSGGGASGARAVIPEATPGDYWIFLDTSVGDGGPVRFSIAAERLDPPCEGGFGPDSDGDGLCDDGDEDDDGDTVPDEEDNSPLDVLSCRDSDGDLCDDCVGGEGPAPERDGVDSDGDGLCDLGDEDDDNDTIVDEEDNCPLLVNPAQADNEDDGIGDLCDEDDDNDRVPDLEDSDPNNGLVCADLDEDGCDDCSSGVNSPRNDGDDQDRDGLCNLGDEDDDNDGAPDLEDSDPLDSSLCVDADGDGCDDCAVASIDPLNDGPDLDGDGLCDGGDEDDDGDGVSDALDNCPRVENPPAEEGGAQADSDEDGIGDACDDDSDNDTVPDRVDSDPLDPMVCRDLDRDSCDDCAVAGAPETDNDGLDTDGDGRCDEGDTDDDGDRILDLRDNCPLVANPDQLNSDAAAAEAAGAAAPPGDELGDLCDDDDDNDLVNDEDDNCPLVANRSQDDLDGDEIGDICDSDIDGDTVLNALDLNPRDPLICDDSDADGCDDCSVEGRPNPENDGDGPTCAP